MAFTILNLLIFPIFLVVPFAVLYFVIKFAMRNGMVEAHEIIKARENRF
ncbi:MAG: hypothetical protein IJE29_00075 [Firmicutes bacterium]|nr:hypothetical protein [Bacillota bacterium]MBQ3198743.1 hypothetical protein [Bacillota bacterium]